MSDNYNVALGEDPQSKGCLVDARVQKALRRNTATEKEVQFDRDIFAAQKFGLEDLKVAEFFLEELKAAEFEFANYSTLDPADPIRPIVYDRRLYTWRHLPATKEQWEVLLRTQGSLEGTLGRTYYSVLSAAREECEEADAIVLNRPIDGVCFANGVFDLNTGRLRSYTAEDGRTFLGSSSFVPDAEGDPLLVNELIGFMAGGDANKEKLIRAACYLNIVGLHKLPAFKSAFFIWSCEEGFGGRSSLFRVINKAAGGDAVVTISDLRDLTDPNTLSRLCGRNYVHIDECQVVSSARSKAVSTLKNITGGVTKLEVKVLFKDRFEIEGHWIVNQALNSTEFLYGADPALVQRCVPIVTCRIPKEAEEAFKSDPLKQETLLSDTECSRFLKSLWNEFGHPANAARVVDEVKRLYDEDLQSMVSQSDPLTEFCEEWVVQAPGKSTPLSKVLDAFNSWLRHTYPNNKQVSIRNLATGLRKIPDFKVEKETTGAKATCLVGWEVDKDFSTRLLLD